jgi:pimeloyl-ACP methyl ester carboxylesterase
LQPSHSGKGLLKSRWARILFRILRILALVYLGLLLFVFFRQRSFLYRPNTGPRGPMESAAQERGFQAWENEAGQFIGWKFISPAKRAHGQLLIVHGNSGCAIDRLDYADELRSIEPLDVYILEYPGFGARAGSPSQKSFFYAADEAIRLLKKAGTVYVMGESLGTGVASYLAGTYPDTVQGMLLVAPYNNMTGVAQMHMPIFPVSLLLLDRFPSEKFLENYHGPVAMLFAGADVVVPNRFGHKLYDGYQGPKRFWEIPLAGHDDLLNQTSEWWRELVQFWESKPSLAKSDVLKPAAK